MLKGLGWFFYCQMENFMMQVAILGRPNVGKSTLFNRLAGRKKAIVYSVSGTTRDRNEHEVFWKDKKFIISDTAGWSSEEFIFSKEMAKQVKYALDLADIVLFVVDGKEGLSPDDFEIAKTIRAAGKKTILVVNKIDNHAQEMRGYEFYKLGFDDSVFISAQHGLAINDLLDKIWSFLKHDRRKKNIPAPIKVAVVGKPNVGKSSFVNACLGQERAIVHDQAGTTRDALPVPLEVNGKHYILIDTAGMHRANKPQNDMQYLSTLSASHAIDDCDIAILMSAADQGIGETETKIARIIVDKRRGIVLAMNKWDLIDEKELAGKYFTGKIKQSMKFMSWADIIFISAKTSQRVKKVFEQVDKVYEQYSREIPQEEIDDTLKRAVEHRPYVTKGKTLKIKSCIQAASKPPVFVFAVNNPDLVHFSYERYLENRFREAFGLKGTPIILKFKKQIHEASTDKIGSKK
jgi:GTP-binding protein